MMGFFPTPYDDELLYSWIARYHVYSGYTSVADCYKDLYYNKNLHPSVEFMNNLLDGAKAVMMKYMPMEDVICNHTMFPLYARFIDQIKRERLLKEADFSVGNWSNTLMRPVSSGERYLKYCPICVQEDMEKYGEPYWHRKHQIHGIKICVKHGAYLRNSDIIINHNLTRLKAAGVSIRKEDEHLHCDDDNIMKLAYFMDAVFTSSKYSHEKIGSFLNDKLDEKYSHDNGDRKLSLLYDDYRKYYYNFDEDDLMSINLMARILGGHKGAFHHVCQLALFEGIDPNTLLYDGDEALEDDLFLKVSQRTGEPVERVELIGKAVIEELKNSRGRIARKARQTDAIEKDDIRLLPKVKQIAEDLYGYGDKRPKKVSVSSVSRLLGVDSHRLKKMDRCMEIINQYYESQEHYWAREIVWAVKQIEKNGDPLNYKHIRMLTNLRKDNVSDSLKELMLLDKDIYFMVIEII